MKAAAMTDMKEERCVVCVCEWVLWVPSNQSNTFYHSIFADVGQYVFDPKASSSSKVAKGNYFDQPAREKEVTAKGERVLVLSVE